MSKTPQNQARSPKLIWLFVVALAVLASPLVLFQAGRSSLSVHAVPRVGTQAPDFALQDIGGETVRLSQFLGREPVFLNFWASWCLACREEARYNQKVYEQWGPKGLRFLSVSIDNGAGSSRAVREFMEEFQSTFVPLLDSGGEVYPLYAVSAIPTTFLIDRQGRIVAKSVGPENWLAPRWRDRWLELFDGTAAKELAREEGAGAIAR